MPLPQKNQFNRNRKARVKRAFPLNGNWLGFSFLPLDREIVHVEMTAQAFGEPVDDFLFVGRGVTLRALWHKPVLRGVAGSAIDFAVLARSLPPLGVDLVMA
jgi:hypothetical protein